MSLDHEEAAKRKFVEETVQNMDVTHTKDKSVIREEALAMLARELDGKIENLQEGETLFVGQIIEIIGPSGKVRGGSGAQRNMPEYIAWRKAVYERDEYKCQDCGSTKKLNAHHIKSWQHHPDLRFDVDNGKSVCFECHKKYHPHLNFYVS